MNAWVSSRVKRTEVKQQACLICFQGGKGAGAQMVGQRERKR
jgi:hypothetical protein